jgi:Icc-related predicted phosphoesterase
MKIVHGSDWHGKMRECPEADLYVFTGDMLPDFFSYYDNEEPRSGAAKQASWAAKFASDGGMRRFLKSPDAPIVCVRGNHDFCDIGPLFATCNLIKEFICNEVADITIGNRTLRVTGHRGVPQINGMWSDEEARGDLKERYRAMPMADVYLTHYPPAGILDSEGGPKHCGDKHERYRAFGLEGLADWLLYRSDKSLLCFGHIHECGGSVVKHSNVIFSNAACSINEIDL